MELIPKTFLHILKLNIIPIHKNNIVNATTTHPLLLFQLELGEQILVEEKLENVCWLICKQPYTGICTLFIRYCGIARSASTRSWGGDEFDSRLGRNNIIIHS